MRVLALDTATPLCGVAVLCSEGGLAAVRQEVVTTHSDRLLGLVSACLEEAGLSPRDLDGVVCGAGPGSFTGLRIGAATAKGLCLGLGVPLVMVSSLAVLAAQHAGAAEVLLPCIDAWRGQVYAQLFPPGWQGRPGDPRAEAPPPALAQPAAWEPEALRQAVAHLAGRLAACGDGARRYPALCPAGARRIEEAAAPDPLVLARLGLARLIRGERDDLAAAVPDYACPSAAELSLPRDPAAAPGLPPGGDPAAAPGLPPAGTPRRDCPRAPARAEAMHAYIGLGANLGDRAGALGRAAALLGEAGAVLRRSAIYETAPVGPPQPDYLNAALLLDTALGPLPLLDRLLAIEAVLGRRRDPAERYAPRTLDLDVLLLGPGGQIVLREPRLTVPHPRLHERAFALRPLLDLDEALRHPLSGAPLRALYAACVAADGAAPRQVPAGPGGAEGPPWPAP